MEEETTLNEKIKRMREEYDEKQGEIMEIERQRRNLQLEQECNYKRRELEQIEQQIEEDRRNVQQMAENESKFKEYDKKL